MLLIVAGIVGMFTTGVEALGSIGIGAFFIMRSMHEPSAAVELLAVIRGGLPPSGGSTA